MKRLAILIFILACAATVAAQVTTKEVVQVTTDITGTSACQVGKVYYNATSLVNWERNNAGVCAAITSGGTPGNVVGPASSIDSEIAIFSGTGGKTLKRASGTGIVKETAGVIGVAGASDLPSGIDAAKIGGGGVSTTEFDFLGTITSNVQTQIDGKQTALGFTPENSANKDAASGYAGLDASTLLKAAEFPAFTGDATKPSGSLVTTVVKVNGNTPGGACTNQFTRSIDSSGRPTCASVAIGSDVSGLGTGVATAAAVNGGSVGSFVVNGGAGGTPSSLTLNNGTGLPLTTGVTGILPTANGGTGIAFFTAAGPTVARVYTFPDAAATIARTDAGQTFTGVNNFTSPNITTGINFNAGGSLLNEAANVIAQRNGATGQILRIYAGYTDASNYARLNIDTTGGGGNATAIYTEKAGSGTSQVLRFGTGGNVQWGIDTSGNFLALTDNTNDIGASGATRPRDFFLGRNASVGGTLSVTGHTTFEGVASTGATGTGSLVYSAGPTLTGTTTASQINSTTILNGHTSALGRLGESLEVTTSANYGGGAFNTFSTSAAQAPVLDFNRSKSGTKGTQTVVASGDSLGYVIFNGSDGTAFLDAAYIKGVSDGTPGTNDMPGRLEFYTTLDGASTGTLRMKIDNAGHIFMPNISTAAGATGADACFQGSGATQEITTDTALCIVSARRFKNSIQSDHDGLAFIKQLRPVHYFLNEAPERGRQYGFVAEEVEKVNKDFVTYQKDGQIRSVLYIEIISKLTAAVQEQQEEITTRDVKMASLALRLRDTEQMFKKQQAQIEALKADVKKLKGQDQ